MVGEPCIDNVMHGFNACVLAYGQTGSGKTYTMLGPTGDQALHDESLHALRGLIPRMLEKLFEVWPPKLYMPCGNSSTKC